MSRITVNVHLYLTEYTEQTAFENLSFLKSMGMHVTATSPKPLPARFYELVDVFLHDKENQLLIGHYDEREPVYYYTRQNGFTMHFERIEKQTHGLAVLRSMIKGCELASMNEFDWVLRIEFDDLLSSQSLDRIRKIADRLEKDMLIFRNDYGNRRDLSVHTMLYRPDKFLSVFGHTKTEQDWIDNISKYCDYGNPILEELMLAMIEDSVADVEFIDGRSMEETLPGSIFNLHQSPANLASGCLADIMRCGEELFFGAWCVNQPGGTVTFVSDGAEQNHEFLAGHWAYSKIMPGTSLAQIKVEDKLIVEHYLADTSKHIGSSITFHQ